MIEIQIIIKKKRLFKNYNLIKNNNNITLI
jgi:hypothetical protein